MLHHIKTLLLGSPLPTRELTGHRLNKIRALAAFSPDALSSIAYANQEIYLGLLVAGAAGLSLALPVGLAIVALLGIVALSYSQTIHAYPNGGGSYIVARENLGPQPGLVAAAALMIDYVLTATVSLTAGVDALVSAFPSLGAYRIEIALGILLVLSLANLRGLNDSGTLMAIPVYLFLLTYLPMLLLGLARLLQNGPSPLGPVAPPPIQPLGLLVVLHAFAAGCTALTGVEAISNGVPAFQPPEAKNARKTLLVMTVLMGLLFFGSIGLTQAFAVIAQPGETILSALARRLLGSGPLYFLVQITTLAILAVAANTSFAGFPRVAAIVAGDGYLPHQFTSLGDRLVFANGIIFLAAATSLLILIFQGDTHALVPLFAVGAFLAFTLSQAGMVVHWLRLRQPGWQAKAAINGIGALVTFTSLTIIAISKFVQGAWISIVLIPIFVYFFFRVRRHYLRVSSQLTLRGLPPSLKPAPAPRVIIPIAGVHRGIIEAVNFARSMSDAVSALYIEIEPAETAHIQKQWAEWFPDIPLETVSSPYRSMIGPLMDYLDRSDLLSHDGRQAVLILPEFIPAHWWQGFLHNQTAWLIRMALLHRRRLTGFQHVIIEVPYHLKD